MYKDVKFKSRCLKVAKLSSNLMYKLDLPEATLRVVNSNTSFY